MASNNGKLTMKQELFAIELSKGKSQREAYYIAYPKSKKWKNEAAADTQASILAKNSKVLERINQLKATIVNKWEKKALLEVSDILNFHANVIQSDIKDYLSFKTIDTPIVEMEEGKIKSVKTVSQIGVRIKDSDEVDGKLIKKVSVNNKGDFSFELYDKSDSVKEMARIMGLYNDKSSILFPEPLKVDVTKDLNDDQLEEMLKIYLGGK